jgi:hypothetical protein
MSVLTKALALACYTMDGRTLLGAVVVQLKLLSEARLSLPTLMLKPWKANIVMVNAQTVFAGARPDQRICDLCNSYLRRMCGLYHWSIYRASGENLTLGTRAGGPALTPRRH